MTRSGESLSIAASTALRIDAVNAYTKAERTERLRLLVAASLVVAMLAALWVLPLDVWLDVAAAWSREHAALGGLLYLLASALAAVLFVPGSVIGMSGGYLFGLPYGMAMAAAGGALGAILAFLNGRTFARGFVFGRLRTHPRLLALDRALYERSFLVVMLTRLSLIIPYNVLNYLYGVTGVKKMPYALASTLGLIPAMALWAYVGTLARDFDDILSGKLEAGTAGTVMILVGFGAIVAAVVVVHRTASKALRARLGE